MLLRVFHQLISNVSNKRILCKGGLISEKDKGTGSHDVLGFGSLSSEQMERSTFEMVRAGDQLFFKISRQIFP